MSPLHADRAEMVASSGPDPVALSERIVEVGERFERARLTGRERRLLGLQAAGYSYREISRATGDTVRTVERQLWRARRKLRCVLAS